MRSVTVRNLEVIDVDTEDNVLVVKGAVPGPERRIRGGAEVEEVTAMPTVDVVDLNNQKVGELELADEVFGAEVNEALLYEAVRHYQAGTARRHAQDQGAQRSGRLGQEAVEAEGHGPGARGFGAVAASGATAARCTDRCRAITATSCRKQDGAGRAALGAFRQGAGWRVEGGAGVQPGRTTKPRTP